MPVINHDRVPWQEAAPGLRSRQKFVVSAEIGAQSLSVGLAIMEPGEALPLHTHDVEEFTLILEGEGTEVLGEETLALSPGMTVLVPAGTPHRLSNTGNRPLKTVFGYPGVNVPRKLVH